MSNPKTPKKSLTKPQNSLQTDEVKRVLVVVAHPDDAEYGISAAVANWVSKGIEVAYLLLTAGEAGMKRPPEEAGDLRKKEQSRACEIVGVKRLTILDFPDGMLEYSLALRQAIAKEIRSFKPDAVVTGSGELKVPWGFDHPDHRACALATIDATRDAANKWTFTDLLTANLEPWNVSWLWLTGTEATHFVKISDAECQLAVKSLAAHKAYLDDLPWHPKPRDFIPQMLTSFGDKYGTEYAMGFAVTKL